MQIKTSGILVLSFLTLGLLIFEPALANKFETIGSGVSGSNKIKIEYLRITAFVTASIMFIAGVLSIVMRESNAQYLSYTMWKPSSIIFFILCLVMLGTGFAL